MNGFVYHRLLFLLSLLLCCTLSAKSQSALDMMRGRTAPPRSDTRTDTLVDARMEGPQFPGGTPALMDYVAYHIKYPKSLRKKKYNIGPMTVKFLIKTNGKVEDVQVTSRPTSPDVAEEMSDYVTNIRKVFLGMPRWKPATVNGTPINYQYALPFQVEIN